MLFLCAIMLTNGCKKEDDEPENPLDALPPATQIGAQTFGCLVDGEVFLPKILGRNGLQSFYQNINDTFTLSISTESMEKKTINYSISIGGSNILQLEKKTYLLSSDNSGNLLAFFSTGKLNEATLFTTDTDPGKLIITNFDPENFILSGTFEFTVLDETGTEVKVTNGRFDVKYTN